MARPAYSRGQALRGIGSSLIMGQKRGGRTATFIQCCAMCQCYDNPHIDAHMNCSYSCMATGEDELERLDTLYASGASLVSLCTAMHRASTCTPFVLVTPGAVSIRACEMHTICTICTPYAHHMHYTYHMHAWVTAGDDEQVRPQLNHTLASIFTLCTGVCCIRYVLRTQVHPAVSCALSCLRPQEKMSKSDRSCL